ncbi:DUF1738 domain-containing protein [bacterium]|nr:DUF1738 domain-containing protein [bacterium]
MTIEKAGKQKEEMQQAITNQIIDLLENVDENNYQPPFAQLVSQGLPANPTTNCNYHGGNVLTLWIAQLTRKYNSNHWATYNQWKNAGAQVKKGEKGCRILFYKNLTKQTEDAEGEKTELTVPMLRLHTVFNANQVDGYLNIENALETRSHPEQDQVKRIDLVEQFCLKSGADIRHGGDEAFYSLAGDYINMPETALFYNSSTISATQHYYATLLHELTHWTGANHRLSRPIANGHTSEKDYAYEELVAELGAAFMCAQYGLSQPSRANHAIYIKSWLRLLKDDAGLVLKASANASSAVAYLNELNTRERG